MFVNALISNAKSNLNCRENPPGSNRSLCVDNINKAVHGKVNNWAWCATFVSYVFDKTFKQFGLKNTFLMTAKTADMLKWGKQKGIVDSRPAVGSIMYTSRDGGGHVGLVISVNGNSFVTIDGNSDDSVRTNSRNLSQKNYQFIHTERLFNFKDLAVSNPGLSLGTLLLLAGAGYGVYRYRGGKKLFGDIV